MIRASGCLLLLILLAVGGGRVQKGDVGWGNLRNLGPGINSSCKDDVDIWRFENVDDIWSNPKRMEGPFLSDAHDYDPCLSPDGSRFYFTSDRPGGYGGADLYVVERTVQGQHLK